MTPQAKYMREIRKDPLQREAEAEYQRRRRELPDVKEHRRLYHRKYRRLNKVVLRAQDRARKRRKQERDAEVRRQSELVERGLLMKVRI